MAEPSHGSLIMSAIDATKTAMEQEGMEGLKFQESVNIFVKSLEQLLQPHPDHTQGLKLTPTQSKQLLSTVLPLLLHPAHQRLLEASFFDLFGCFTLLLAIPETTDPSQQILQRIAQVCNPREVLIVCQEQFVRHNNLPAKAKCFLLTLLSIAIGRLPSESRCNFMKSVLPSALGLLDTSNNSNFKSQGQTETLSSDEEEDDNEEKLKEIEIRNAFGDTDQDSQVKYKLNCDVPLLLRAMITLAEPFVQSFHQAEGTHKRLIVSFLLGLLGRGLARADIEPSGTNSQPHYLSCHVIAQQILCMMGRLGHLNALTLLEQPPEDLSRQLYGPHGLGCFAYALLVTGQDFTPLLPCVYSPLYLFCTSMPHMAALLRDAAPATSFKGYRLLGYFLDRLKGACCVDEAQLNLLSSSLDAWLELLKDLITFMVNRPAEQERRTAFRYLNEVFSLAGSWERYRLLGWLLKECPYAGVGGLLVHRVKEEVQRAWPIQGQGSPKSTSSPFASPKLLDLFPFMMISESSPLQHLEIHMSALNLCLFLLLREKNTGPVVGIWNPDVLNWLMGSWFEPLGKRLDENLNSHARDLTTESHGRHGLSNQMMAMMGPAELKRASEAAMTSLHLIRSTLFRIFDLLKEKEEEEEKDHHHHHHTQPTPQ